MDILSSLDWTLIFVYFCIVLFIGLFFRKSGSKTLVDFFVGGRKMPWYLAGLSMVATTFAADTPLAVTEIVAHNGVSGNWIWWNMAIGGMLTTFFFAKLWRRSEVNTELEFINLRYGTGKGAQLLKHFKAIYLGAIMNLLIMGWVNLAMLTILTSFFGVPKHTAYVLLAGILIITVIYANLSGLKGVIFTDSIQFFIAIIGCIVLAIVLLNQDKVGGISGLQEKLPSETFDFFPSLGEQSTSENIKHFGIGIGTFFAFIGLQWWASWYPGAEPGGGGYVAQRMMSTKNEKHALWSTLFFQIAHYCLRPWPWIIAALCTLILYPDLSDPKQGFVLAMKDYLPDGIKGLLFVTFLSAYMSTISTQLNWGTSLIVNDFIKSNFNKLPTKSLLFYGKMVTIILIELSILLCTQIESIENTWKILLGCGAGLGMVLMLRWYWWRINVWSEISASIAPFIIYPVLILFYQIDHTNAFYITTLFTTIIWVLVTYLTKPTSTSILQKFYLKVNPDGFWNVSKAFVSEENDVLFPVKMKGNLLKTLLTWTLSIILVYSVLFSIGYIIFGKYVLGTSLLIISIISGYFLTLTMGKENKK